MDGLLSLEQARPRHMGQPPDGVLIGVPTLAFAGIFGALQFVTQGCGASGFGAEMGIAAAFATAPHSSLWTWLFGLSFERAMEYHKWFAMTAILCTVAHAVACGSDFDGFLLLGTMVGLGITSLSPVRRNFFEFFYRTHWVLFLATAALLLLHDGGKAGLIGFPLWAFDVFYRYFYLAWNKYPRKAMVYSLPANVIRMEFPKGNFAYRAGTYVFLCIPELSYYEWHPFSLSSAPHEEKVSIHIRVLGDWTQKLYDLAHPAGLEGREVEMLIEGPYGEPEVDIDGDKYKSVLLISGGIGITPMQSICNSLIHQFQMGRPMNKIWFVWSCADKYMVDGMWQGKQQLPIGAKEPKIGEVDNNTPVHTLQMLPSDEPTAYGAFVTGVTNLYNRLPRSFSPDSLTRLSTNNMLRKSANDVENSVVFDPLYTEFYLTRARDEGDYADANIDPVLQPYLRFGRPKLEEIFDQMRDMSLVNGDDKVAVLVCGPAGLMSDVRRLSHTKSGGGVQFDFHGETFDL
mmetsp:Transcript_13368/g.28394  ORF Transcript_13368/g.28394 Transcript_13368/m.28394 type:complete len:515 (-) Transcript_13368:309-1853(-)